MDGDAEWMARAVARGERGRRSAPPNPWVGCVLVRHGTVVGEAHHVRPGSPHAERAALAEAAERARGATAYLTLEPCAHQGRTGPCVDALLDAGIARVVVALEDPDARVAGRGIAELRAGGIDVVVGIEGAEAGASLAPYLHHRRTGAAYCVAKTALSIDGRAAAADGSARWITGPQARDDAHGLRADSQAIVVGAGTALTDRPALTVRDAQEPAGSAPLRVLLDARGRVPPDGPLFDPDLGPTLVITTDAVRPEAVDAWRAAGTKVESVAEAGDRGGVDLPAALRLLGDHGVLQALVEGGPTVHGALVAEGLVDRLVVYVGAALVGTGGRPALEWAGSGTIAAAPRFHLAAVSLLGDDVRLDYLPDGNRNETLVGEDV